MLALNGLDVLEAAAYSNDEGMALEVFRVESSFGPTIAWDRVARRPREGPRRPARPRGPAAPSGPGSTPAPHASPEPVAAPVGAGRQRGVRDRPPSSRCGRLTAIGVLYRITRASPSSTSTSARPRCRPWAADVVDAFYVRDRTGAKVTDPDYLVEIERAILHALAPSRLLALTARAAAEIGGSSVGCSGDVTNQDLVRWSEALAGIARTGLGFTENLYERERFEEVLAVAADMRAAAGSHVTHRGARRTSGCTRSARAWPATRRRRWRSAPWSATTTGEILLMQAGRLGHLALPDRLGRHRLLGQSRSR